MNARKSSITFEINTRSVDPRACVILKDGTLRNECDNAISGFTGALIYDSQKGSYSTLLSHTWLEVFRTDAKEGWVASLV